MVSSAALDACWRHRLWAVSLQTVLVGDVDGQPADPEETQSEETNDPQGVKLKHPQQVS